MYVATTGCFAADGDMVEHSCTLAVTHDRNKTNLAE